MNKMLINVGISLFITCYHAFGQDYGYVDKWMVPIQTAVADEENSEAGAEELYEQLSEMSEHPMDLNDPDSLFLMKLPFLSARQVADLMRFLKQPRPLQTVYELKNVRELDRQTVEQLLPFVCVNVRKVDKPPFSVHNLLKYGRNNLIIRYDPGFQQKAGYGSYPDSVLRRYPNRLYRGEAFYHALRYSYTFSDRLKITFNAEKDAGEAFWNRNHKGYDFYTGSVLLKDMNVFQTLVVGDFKASFGQGLVMSQGFSPGRSVLITQAAKRNNGFRSHSSTNEYDFFRGAGLTIRLNRVETSLFYSFRKWDATVQDSSFSSFKTDGLHRLQRDMEKRNKVPVQTFGGNLRWRFRSGWLGCTFIRYSFDSLRMNPVEKPYNLFAFRGRSNMNISVDYLLKRPHLFFYGETAISQNGALATLNELSVTPVSYVSFLASCRYFDKRYQSFYGNVSSQSSGVQNEEGLYLGLQAVPLAHWKVTLFADLFRFPWKRYGVDSPSTGKEYRVQVDYSQGAFFSSYLRFSYSEKEKNGEGAQVSHSIVPYKRNKVRWQMAYQPFFWLSGKTSADGILCGSKGTKSSRGWMVSESLSFGTDKFPLQLNLFAGIFHTDDYASRIYSYEKGLLYAFNMPSFYGKGIRLSANVKWSIYRDLYIAAKFSHSHYNDRTVIGSGTEQIDGPNKEDLQVMLRWKF
jgi:hypothetical protein